MIFDAIGTIFVGGNLLSLPISAEMQARTARQAGPAEQNALASMNVSAEQLSQMHVVQWCRDFPQRPSGIHWTQTGGKTWSVEVVR